jgi:hypothetical protein
MNNKVFVGVIMFGAIQGANAIPLCTDYAAISGTPGATSATMAQYAALGSSGCQVGDKVFSDFEYLFRPGPKSASPSNPGGDPVVTSSDVTVKVDDNLNNPVFTFSANWLATNGNQVNLDIGYVVTVQAGGLPILSASTELAGRVTDLTVNDANPQPQWAYVTSAETVANGGVYHPDTSMNPRIDLGFGSTEFDSTYALSDCAGHFNDPHYPNCAQIAMPPSMAVTVFKDIFLNSGSDGDGGSADTALLTDVREALVEGEVPEPLTFVLYGGGLLAIGVVGRLSRRRIRQARPTGKDNTSHLGVAQ